MKIAAVDLFPVALPMHAVLTLPRGPSRTIAEGKQIVLTRVTADDGTVGWGEAGPSRRWSAETVHSCYTSLKHFLAPAVIGRDPFDIAGLHAAMNQELAPGLDPGQPVAKSAIDIAVHDLVCRKLGIPLQAWLGTRLSDRVEMARLVSAPDPDKAAELTEKAKADGYKGFKVKVGGNRPEHDAAVLEAVVKAAGDGYVWPDANQGYTLDAAIVLARACERLGITMFEQPVAMSDTYAMKKLLSATSVRIVLDEAAMGLPFIVELLRREAVEGLAIKITKCGGLHYARQMCDLARNAGLTLIGSGLMDAPINFSASVHLFAGYGMDLPVDLNGPQFISDDYLAKPVPMDGKAALVADAPGHGLEVDMDKVTRYALDLAA
ncbi:MAG: enolase C-terminal domain-like protein [Azospirillaceae bacterium]